MPRALPYLLLLPATLFLCVFFLYPFVLVAVESLTRGGAWTVENYQRMVSHWKFGVTFRNTLLLAAVVVPVQLVMSLAMASIVTRLQTGRSTILYIFAIPLGISDLAAGLIWLTIFEQSGFLNSFLSAFGLIEQPILFLGYQKSGDHLRRHRAGRDLAGHRDHDGDPRGRHGPDPQGIRRSGGGFRRLALAALHPRYPADAAAQPADRADPADHPRLRGLCRSHGAGRHPVARC